MDEDKAISLEDLDDELEEYTFDMEGGAEPEISDESINLATDSSAEAEVTEAEVPAAEAEVPVTEAEVPAAEAEVPAAEAEVPAAEADTETGDGSIIETEGLLEYED